MTKESFERGYMTSREIKNKLKKRFGDYETKDEFGTNPQRLAEMRYLSGILKKKNVLAPETQQSVYHILDDLFSDEVRSRRWKYNLSGFSKAKVFHVSAAAKALYNQANLAAEFGDVDKARRLYNEAKRFSAEEAKKTGIYGNGAIWDLADQKISELGANSRSVGLEKFSRVTSVIAGASLLGGLFLLSPSVTGNAISNFSTKTTSLWGIVLILVAILAVYIWIQARKNKVEVQQKVAVKKIKKVSKKSRRK